MKCEKPMKTTDFRDFTDASEARRAQVGRGVLTPPSDDGTAAVGHGAVRTQRPTSPFPIRAIREGMSVVRGAFSNTRERNCRADRNQATLGTCWYC